MGLDDGVVTAMDPEVVLVDSEQVGDPPVVQQNLNVDEIPLPQDARVSLNFVSGSETVLMCDSRKDQENTPPPPSPAKFNHNPTATQFSVSRKTAVPSSASSPCQFHYDHSLASVKAHVHGRDHQEGELHRRDPVRDQILSVVHVLCSRGSRHCMRVA